MVSKLQFISITTGGECAKESSFESVVTKISTLQREASAIAGTGCINNISLQGSVFTVDVFNSADDIGDITSDVPSAQSFQVLLLTETAGNMVSNPRSGSAGSKEFLLWSAFEAM